MFSTSRLMQIRTDRHLTRSQVHRELVRAGSECCRSLVDRWESGRSEPSASDLELLANVLQVPMADLFEPGLKPVGYFKGSRRGHST